MATERNTEIARRYMENRHATLWADWEIVNPERRKLAVEWLAEVLDECDGVAPDVAVLPTLDPELRGTHADLTAGLPEFAKPRLMGQPVPYRPIGLTIRTENGRRIGADGHSYLDDAGW